MTRHRAFRPMSWLTPLLLGVFSLALAMGRPGVMLGGLPCGEQAAAHAGPGVWMLKNGDACGFSPRLAEQANRPQESDNQPDTPAPTDREHTCWVCSSVSTVAAPTDAPLAFVAWCPLEGRVQVPVPAPTGIEPVEPKWPRGPPHSLVA